MLSALAVFPLNSKLSQMIFTSLILSRLSRVYVEADKAAVYSPLLYKTIPNQSCIHCSSNNRCIRNRKRTLDSLLLSDFF